MKKHNSYGLRVGEPCSQLATRVPKALHRRLRLHCLEADVSMMDVIVAALREKLAAEAKRAE